MSSEIKKVGKVFWESSWYNINQQRVVEPIEEEEIFESILFTNNGTLLEWKIKLIFSRI